MSIFRQICVNYSNCLQRPHDDGAIIYLHNFFVDKCVQIGKLLEILTEMVEEKFLEYI